MKDIKFRAWIEDKELGNIWAYFGLWDNNFWIKEKESPVMQYTGLKDKNGKEIYEGDILKSSFNWISVVEYKAPNFIDRVLVQKSQKYESTHYMHGEENAYEIIGNIYENPDLLDKEVTQHE